MDSSARPLPAGATPLGQAPATASPFQQNPPAEAAPLAKLRQQLPTESSIASVPLRQQAVAVGSHRDLKSSTVAGSDSPKPASRPGLQQLAELGARSAQFAKADGKHSTSPSAWFVALGVTDALPGLYRVGCALGGPGLPQPPRRSDEHAMARQAIASLALDHAAPLPAGDALVDQMLDLGIPPGAAHDASATALLPRLEGIGFHLDALVIQADEPLDAQAPSRRFLTRLDTLDQAIRSLLADTSADVPAPLRTELTRLGERITVERGFAQRADAFARAHDTGDLNFEDIMAYMRHGTTAQQLHFILFEQAVMAAYRASFVTGTPVDIPPGVAIRYDDLWQQVVRRDLTDGDMGTPPLPSTTVSSSSSMSGVPRDPPASADEPGYRDYDPGPKETE